MPDAALPTVLIVDDDDDIRLGLRHMLEQLEELDITGVGDGQAALDAMERSRFDLLLLDINLPLVSGDAILTLIGLNEGFKRPGYIVVMSAESNLAQIRSRPEFVIVDSVLTKPFRYEALQDIVVEITTQAMDDLLE